MDEFEVAIWVDAAVGKLISGTEPDLDDLSIDDKAAIIAKISHHA